MPAGKIDTIVFKRESDASIYADKVASDAVAIFVNGRSLIESVREIELPYATQEGREQDAGNYVWLRLNWLPDIWLHFHGTSEQVLFYPFKTNLLECGTCGVSECWPLLVRIEVKGKSIVWRLFEQPYRRKKYETRRIKHWKYVGFGPFRFDREQYESALRSLGAELQTA